jgi:hypothetical protein
MDIERRRIATLRKLIKQLQQLSQLRDQVRRTTVSVPGRTGGRRVRWNSARRPIARH